MRPPTRFDPISSRYAVAYGPRGQPANQTLRASALPLIPVALCQLAEAIDMTTIWDDGVDPTTGEFGPSGAYDDFEMHQHLATRLGFSNRLEPQRRPCRTAERESA